MGKLRIVGKASTLMYYETADEQEEMLWTEDDSEQIDKARQAFQKYFMKGWIAYAIAKDNTKKQVFSFDPEYKEIVLLPIASGG